MHGQRSQPARRKKCVTVEPICWIIRSVRPDGTERPPFDGVVTAVKVSCTEVALMGALGCAQTDGVREVMRALKERLGFETVSMTRHGRTRRYPIEALLGRARAAESGQEEAP